MQIDTTWQHRGITSISDFVTTAEEQQLLAGIAQTAGRGTVPTSRAYRNSIQRFGAGDIYKDNLVATQIPEYFRVVIDRLLAEQLIAAEPDAVTVNEYLAGQTIHPHIDALEAGPVITVLSLLSPAEMIFTLGAERFVVGLPARSLVQMRGVGRYDWRHEIAPVESTRYSVVFRGKAC